MTVFEATCDPEPRLSVSVDATLGSEVGAEGAGRGWPRVDAPGLT